ncbi:DUF1986 domain-containing protein [Actinomadura roseirufa]|uniref:DUF1986 domain-containing protein n=1 Tax=Actinomadura roseirufa TaxID=2094049 RepID=UPI0010414276|nr:DUF1986 domain-containing protein [Actinomadura roseirufa]
MRIVGGDVAGHLFGQVQIFGDGEYECTGSLIHREWVLTAKHCTPSGSLYEVRIGTLQQGQGGEVRTVDIQARHPDVDVTLLHLSSPVSQANYVVPYDDTWRVPPMRNVGVHGWGATVEFGTTPSPVLKSATLRVDQNDADPPPGAGDDWGFAGSLLLMTSLHGAPYRGDSGAGVFYGNRVMGVFTSGLRDDATSARYGVNLNAIRGWVRRISGQPPTHNLNWRVMALGSSTTWGEGSSHGNGYRQVLDQGLQKIAERNGQETGESRTAAALKSDTDDTPQVDLVGTVRVGTMADRDNEGWRGLKINEIAGKAGCPVKLYRPNVVTLIAGGNDVVQNYQMDGAVGRLESLIEQIDRDAEEVTVLVSGVQPFSDPAMNTRGKAFSAQIPSMVDRLAGRGLNVVYVDISALGSSDIGSDGIHPTDQGYQKIGDAFVKAAEHASEQHLIPEPSEQDPDEVSDACGTKDDGSGGTGDNGPGKLGEGWDDRGVVQSQQFPSNSRFWMTDINKDHKAEFVVVGPDQKFRFWWNGGPSGKNWVPFVEGQNSYTPKAGAVGNMLRFGDMDGDGFPDCMVVSLNGTIDLYTWKADNPSGARMCTDHYEGVANVFANGSNDGDRPPLNIDPNTKIRIADVTGGGRDDYLLIEPDGTTTAWYNKGFQVNRTYQYLEWEVPQRISGPLQLPREIRYADINGDKRADRILITANGGARAWLNEGPGGSGGTYRDIGKIAGDAEVPPKDVQFADMDGDGKADFLRIGWTGVTHAWLNKLPANYFDTFHP